MYLLPQEYKQHPQPHPHSTRTHAIMGLLRIFLSMYVIKLSLIYLPYNLTPTLSTLLILSLLTNHATLGSMAAPWKA